MQYVNFQQNKAQGVLDRASCLLQERRIDELWILTGSSTATLQVQYGSDEHTLHSLLVISLLCSSRSTVCWVLTEQVVPLIRLSVMLSSLCRQACHSFQLLDHSLPEPQRGNRHIMNSSWHTQSMGRVMVKVLWGLWHCQIIHPSVSQFFSKVPQLSQIESSSSLPAAAV